MLLNQARSPALQESSSPTGRKNSHFPANRKGRGTFRAVEIKSNSGKRIVSGVKSKFHPHASEAGAIPDDFPETASGIREQQQSGHKKAAWRRLFLLNKVAKRTGLEPATSSVTGWRSNRTELPLHDLGCRPCLAAGTWRLIQALPWECKTRNHFFLHAGFSCWEKQVK